MSSEERPNHTLKALSGKQLNLVFTSVFLDVNNSFSRLLFVLREASTSLHNLGHMIQWGLTPVYCSCIFICDYTWGSQDVLLCSPYLKSCIGWHMASLVLSEEAWLNCVCTDCLSLCWFSQEEQTPNAKLDRHLLYQKADTSCSKREADDALTWNGNTIKSANTSSR